MNCSTKDSVIREIIETEGGYVDDPSDSGGKTKYGVTFTVARSYGYLGDMKDLPYDVVFDIYADRYWNPLQLDLIVGASESVAKELADTGVNMGISRTGKFLQRSLNALNNQQRHFSDLVVDGAVGAKTIMAFNAYYRQRGNEGMKVLYNMLNCLQGEFYVALAERRQKDEKFVYGWFDNRVTIS